MNLSPKEQSLLKDQLKHEKVCIQKYQNYANQASDQQLKQLFQNYAQQEQHHYNTIKQILNGQVPSTNQSQAGQQSAVQAQSPAGAMSIGLQNLNNTADGTTKSVGTQDVSMCNDMLMTEKYVSGAYDTAIFEFSQANVRQALNHIQKEEQQHGEGIFNYMQSTGI
jgi:spore coat protein CotF